MALAGTESEKVNNMLNYIEKIGEMNVWVQISRSGAIRTRTKRCSSGTQTHIQWLG